VTHTAAVAVGGPLICAVGIAACVAGGHSRDDAPTGYGITFYEPFDNSRDFGPGYLAGPPHTAIRYDNDHGRRSEEHPLVETDTNGTTPSIPDATRSPHREVPSAAASASEPTNATQP
jgi:hypothetical protein